MEKTKGFTLIELLAVIIVLAIIALIATPIVMNVIKKSEVKTAEQSIDNYVDAIELKLARELLADASKKVDGTYNVADTEVQVEGKLPAWGKYIVSKAKITSGTFCISGYKIEYSPERSKNIGACYTQVPPKSFAEDSWDTIIEAVKAGNLSKYKVGDTKEIKLNGFTNTESNSNGLYTVRIANTSTPEECNQAGFSQSACGFVIEFADIITKHNMNPSGTYKGVSYSYGWNKDGWPASSMRTYVNDTIYNALPPELKANIINTKVVSSHGSSDTSNFTSTDKLYLLSTKEVWGGSLSYDTATSETRQLDYYKNLGVTTSNYSGAIKTYNGSNSRWWLRSASSIYTYIFFNFSTSDDWNYICASDSIGVAAAFRLSE